MTRPAAMMTSPSWRLLLGLTKGACACRTIDGRKEENR